MSCFTETKAERHFLKKITEANISFTSVTKKPFWETWISNSKMVKSYANIPKKKVEEKNMRSSGQEDG